MSYKTILLGLVAGDERNEVRLNTTMSLAAAQNAHVTALYMIPPFNSGLCRGADPVRYRRSVLRR